MDTSPAGGGHGTGFGTKLIEQLPDKHGEVLLDTSPADVGHGEGFVAPSPAVGVPHFAAEIKPCGDVQVGTSVSP